tara:strand:+ start:1317 stop:3215 length:1899 start_codon:yes stop_codon:yes gene_type:complete
MSKNIVEFVAQFSGKQNSSFVKARKGVDDMQKKIDEINKKTIAPKISKKSSSGFNGLSKSIGGVQTKMAGMASSIPMVGGSLSGLITAINPVTLAITALGAGIVAVGHHLIGVQKEVDNTRNTFAKFSQDGKELEELTSKSLALQRVFKDIDPKELSDSVKIMSKEFGISSIEALKLIEDGLVATNGAIDLDNIKEYSAQFVKTGESAEKFVSVIAMSENEGFYMDKGIDSLKEFKLRMDGMNKGTQDALAKVGISGKEMNKQLSDGSLTSDEAFKKIFKNIDTLDNTTKQDLISNVLGAPGEDVGERFITSVMAMEGGLDGLIEKSGESAKRNQELLKSNNKLAETQTKTAKKLRPIFRGFDDGMLKLQTAFAEFLAPIIEWVVDVGADLWEIFGPGLIDNFKMIGTVIKIAFTPFMILMKVVKGIIHLIAQLVTGIRKFATYLGTVVKKAIVSVLGQEMVDKIKGLWDSVFTFIGAKWEQLSTMMKATFDAISEGLAGNFDASTKAFEKAKKAGEALFSSDINVNFDGDVNKDGKPMTEDEKKDKAKEDAEKARIKLELEKNNNKIVEENIGGNVDSKVTGSSSSVKNIKIEIENLGNFEGATLTTENLGDFEKQLTQALLRVANSINTI